MESEVICNRKSSQLHKQSVFGPDEIEQQRYEVRHIFCNETSSTAIWNLRIIQLWHHHELRGN